MHYPPKVHVIDPWLLQKGCKTRVFPVRIWSKREVSEHFCFREDVIIVGTMGSAQKYELPFKVSLV